MAKIETPEKLAARKAKEQKELQKWRNEQGFARPIHHISITPVYYTVYKADLSSRPVYFTE